MNISNRPSNETTDPQDSPPLFIPDYRFEVEETILTYEQKLVKVDEEREKSESGDMQNIKQIILFCSCFSLSLLVKVRKNREVRIISLNGKRIPSSALQMRVAIPVCGG
jgi:hypothetical protein